MKTALRMSESGGMEVSEQQLVELHQASRCPRGQMVHADPGACAREVRRRCGRGGMWGGCCTRHQMVLADDHTRWLP